MFNSGPLTKCPRCGLTNTNYLIRDGSDGESGYAVYTSDCSCGAEYEATFDNAEAAGIQIDAQVQAIQTECRNCGETYDLTTIDGAALGLCHDCRYPDSDWGIEYD